MGREKPPTGSGCGPVPPGFGGICFSLEIFGLFFRFPAENAAFPGVENVPEGLAGVWGGMGTSRKILECGKCPQAVLILLPSRWCRCTGNAASQPPSSTSLPRKFFRIIVAAATPFAVGEKTFSRDCGG